MRQLVERNDDFIVADEAEILAHQFVRHVRIGLARIEQSRVMLELRLFQLELRKFSLPLVERAVITPQASKPFGPATAWPAKVPTTMTASAGIADLRIRAKMRFVPFMTPHKNHEDAMKARTNGRIGGYFADKSWIKL